MAHAARACRRAGESTTPVGHWCAGVSTTAPDPGRRQRRDDDAVLVDRHRHHGHAGRRSGDGPGLVVARVLEADPRDTARGQGLQREHQALGEAGAGDDPAGVGRRAAHSVEVAGQHLPQPHRTGGLGIAERRTRCLPGRLTHRPRPVVAREAGQVGHRRHEVEGRSRRRTAGGCSRRGRPGRRRDASCRTGSGDQVALGVQLVEALHHQAARDAQVAGQLTGRRQSLARAQPAGAHRLAEPALELAAQRLGRLAVQRDEQLGARTGPFHSHRTGPYRRTSCWATLL